MPTNISTNSEPAMEKKGTPALPATARASRVLPVPGGRQAERPWAFWHRYPRNAWGLCRKSTISCRLSLASSSPATSANLMDLPSLNDILFGTGFAAAKNHAVGAAGHFTDPLAHHAVEPDDQDDHGQQRDDPAQQGIHPGGLVVHLAKGNAGAFQPVDQLQVLRNGVGAVGGIVLSTK